MNKIKKLIQCCYIIVILIFSISSFSASLEKSVVVYGPQDVDFFWKSILPIMSVKNLEEGLKKGDDGYPDCSYVIGSGGIKKLKSYCEQGDFRRKEIVSFFKSSQLPSSIVDLVEKYRDDSISKGVLVRDFLLLCSIGRSEELCSVLTDFNNLPVPELPLLLNALLNTFRRDIFMGSRTVLDPIILMEYIDKHYPIQKNNQDELMLFTEVALRLWAFMQIYTYPVQIYSQLFLWLIKHGVSLDRQYGEEKSTLLHYVVGRGDMGFAQQLLDMGASVIILDSNGYSVLDLLEQLGLRYLINIPSIVLDN